MALDKLKYTYQDPARVSELNVDGTLNVTNTINTTTLNTTTVNSKAEVISPTASNVGLTLRSSDTPSTDLQQFRSSSNVLNSGINAAGQMYIGSTTAFPQNAYNLLSSSMIATSTTTANIFYTGGIQPVFVGQQLQTLNTNPSSLSGTFTVTSLSGGPGNWTISILGSGFTTGATNIGSGLFRVSPSLSIRPTLPHMTPLVIQADPSQQHYLVEFLGTTGSRVAYINSNGGAQFSSSVNVGSGSLIGSNIQESGQSGSVINLGGITANANNTGSVRVQGRFAAQLPLIVRGSTGGANPITTATANGTTVTYTAGQAIFFTVGQQVTITGVVSTGNPSATAGAGFNLTNVTISAATTGTFSVTNSLVDTYTSGGTFTSPNHYADLTQWQDANSSVVARVTAAGGAAFTGNTVISGGLSVSGNYGGSTTMGISNSQNIIGLSITGVNGQTSNLQDWRYSGGTVLSGVNAAGQIYSGTASSVTSSNGYYNWTAASASSTTVATYTSGASYPVASVGQTIVFSGFTPSSFNATCIVTAISGSANTYVYTVFNVLATFVASATATAFGNAVNSPTISAVSNNFTTVPLVVRAASNQLLPIQEWQNSSGGFVAFLNSSGYLGLSGIIDVASNGAFLATGPSSPITINTRTSSIKGLIVKGVASQTANLQEWQNASNVVLSAIDTEGNFTKGDGDQFLLAGQIF
jgi:hypothetical protein